MRRIALALPAAVALSVAMAATSRPAAAVAGFDSAYAGESAFLSLAPGQSGTFIVFFANIGTTGWARGTSAQVDLAACRADKLTCDAQDSSEVPFNSGWLSGTRYATTVQSTVAPGAIGTFSYMVAVPATQAAGTYRFNGALVLSSTGADIHNEGYFQDLTVAVISNPAPVITSVEPTLAATAGGTVVTVTGSGFVCTPAFPSVSFGGPAGTTTACSDVSITVTAPAHAAGTVTLSVSNPGSGPSNTTSFTFVDTGIPQFVSVSAAGNTITLSFSEAVCRTAALLTGDVVYAVNGGAQTDPQSLGGEITTSGLRTCSPNPPTGSSPSIVGAQAFSVYAQAPFAQGDLVTVRLVNASGRVVDLAGNRASTATQQAAAASDTTAPAIASAAVTATNTIRLTYSEPVSCNNAQPSQFTATPSGGTAIGASGLTCDLGLSAGSGGSATVTVTFPSAVSPNGVSGSVSYAQSGTPQNRVKDLVGNDATSPQTVTYTGFVPQAPRMVDARITTSGGFGTQLDGGDAFGLAFNAKMSAASPSSIALLLRDSDGTSVNLSCASGVSCSWNGLDLTLGGTTYGFNEVLTVTVIVTPMPISGFGGTVPGLQLPVTITDVSGVADPSGLQVDLTNSPDRIIDAE